MRRPWSGARSALVGVVVLIVVVGFILGLVLRAAHNNGDLTAQQSKPCPTKVEEQPSLSCQLERMQAQNKSLLEAIERQGLRVVKVPGSPGAVQVVPVPGATVIVTRTADPTPSSRGPSPRPSPRASSRPTGKPSATRSPSASPSPRCTVYDPLTGKCRL